MALQVNSRLPKGRMAALDYDRKPETYPWRRVLLAGLLVIAFLSSGSESLHKTVRYCLGAAPLPPGPIDWSPCGNGFECGYLAVPLDYQDATAGTAILSVGRYLATNKSRLGSVFVNPGGPGGSGVNFLYRAGPQLSEVFDGAYDIVSWDPRGINNTTPRVECFEDKRAQDLYYLENASALEFANLTDPAELERLRSQIRTSNVESKLLAQLCHENSGKTLRHVGTTTVVRDLEYFSSVLEGKDTPVNYAGFSYGTAIGAYFVNLFPHRVGRVLIDGVVDPILWANVPAYTWGPTDFIDSEKAFQNFVESCVKAGPDRCALANNATSASQLNKKIRTLLLELSKRPLPVPHSTRPGLLRGSDVRDTIFSGMYRPRGWPELARLLEAALSGDGAPILNSEQAGLNLSDTTSPQKTGSANYAVLCTDGPPLANKYSDEEVVDLLVNAAIDTYDRSSTMFAGLAADPICFHWKARAGERFTGPFNSSLANPILIIGNTADPICPLANAQVVNGLLANDSRLLIQDGAGHCSLAQVSLCTGKVLREYFLEGKLPTNGKVCGTTEILFPPSSSDSIDGSILGDNATLFDMEGVESAEDVKLLKAMKAFGEAAGEWMKPMKGKSRPQL